MLAAALGGGSLRGLATDTAGNGTSPNQVETVTFANPNLPAVRVERGLPRKASGPRVDAWKPPAVATDRPAPQPVAAATAGPAPVRSARAALPAVVRPQPSPLASSLAAASPPGAPAAALRAGIAIPAAPQLIPPPMTPPAPAPVAAAVVPPPIGVEKAPPMPIAAPPSPPVEPQPLAAAAAPAPAPVAAVVPVPVSLAKASPAPSVAVPAPQPADAPAAREPSMAASALAIRAPLGLLRTPISVAAATATPPVPPAVPAPAAPYAAPAPAVLRAAGSNTEVVTFDGRGERVNVVRGSTVDSARFETAALLQGGGRVETVRFEGATTASINVVRGGAGAAVGAGTALFGPATGGTLDRVAFAVDGVESSHGTNLAMWRPEPRGPQGPMQVSAAAALDVGGGDRFDLRQNRLMGRAYLALLYQRYGNWADAIAAYNWGPGNLDQWIAAGRPVERLPLETARYLLRVLRDALITRS